MCISGLVVHTLRLVRKIYHRPGCSVEQFVTINNVSIKDSHWGVLFTMYSLTEETPTQMYPRVTGPEV